MRFVAVSSLLALLLGLTSPFGFQTVVHAQTQTPDPSFNMNTIIGDDQMNDYLSMSVGRIQEFLDAQTGVLKSYVAADGRSAAQIIYDASQVNQISPKVILATTQKEESLITNSTPSQTAINVAMGYGCPDTSSCDPQYFGFTNQINQGTAALRRYLNDINSTAPNVPHTSISGWGPGVAKSITCWSSDYNYNRQICTPGSTIVITPTNAATAALYTYTPHPGGNYAFWNIWNNFNFNLHRVYPDGTLLQAKGSPDVYLIQGGVKRRFNSQTALLATYTLKQVIQVPTDTLLQYDTGTPIYYTNYSLLTAPNRGVYLLANDVKRPIKSKAALVSIGVDPKTAVKASWDILNQFPDGPAITTADIYPAGAIVQNTKNGMIFYVKDGIRYPVPSSIVYKTQFGSRKPIKLAASVLNTYGWGVPVGFPDGSLVQSKTGGPVYFISNGYRLPIASAAAAKAYGFDKIMKNLIKADDTSINVHPLGQTLDVDTGMVTLASM